MAMDVKAARLFVANANSDSISVIDTNRDEVVETMRNEKFLVLPHPEVLDYLRHKTADYDRWLERLAPHAPLDQYRHNDTGEDNADAHMKRQVMGREVVVAVTAGRLDFGRWEQVFYGEFDGRRRKRVLVKIIGE